jgi:hypothetical protein
MRKSPPLHFRPSGRPRETARAPLLAAGHLESSGFPWPKVYEGIADPPRICSLQPECRRRKIQFPNGVERQGKRARPYRNGGVVGLAGKPGPHKCNPLDGFDRLVLGRRLGELN